MEAGVPAGSPDHRSHRRDHRTSHQVLDHLRQYFHHRDVTDPSQGHGGGGQDEISSQDGLKETENDPAASSQGNRKCTAGSSSCTFFSPQISLMVVFPLRLSDPSMTSSCTRLAVWIISEIMAMARCPGSKSLQRSEATGGVIVKMKEFVSCLPND